MAVLNEAGVKTLMNQISSTIEEVKKNISAKQIQVAKSDTLGGIQIGYPNSGLGKNYAVQLNKSNQAYVNVPWEDTHAVSKLVATTNDGTSNATTSNTNTYLKLFDDSTARSSIQIKGTGGTTVSATNGTISINTLIIDNLNDQGSSCALSAKQGYLLNNRIATLETLPLKTGGGEESLIGGNVYKEASKNIASAKRSFAFGSRYVIKDAEGNESGQVLLQATQEGAFATGIGTIASGWGSHTEGIRTVASNSGTHAEGHQTTASGYYAHAGGELSTAGNKCAFVHGVGLTSNAQCQTIFGQYNEATSNTKDKIFILGWGTNTVHKNIFTVSNTGQGIFASSVSATSFIENGKSLSNKYLGKNDSAVSAVKVANKLTITNNGVSVEYDGSNARSITIPTYSDATTSKAGLMSIADKLKLDGIAAGANKYSLSPAKTNALGGIKLGYTQNNQDKNYPVVLDSNHRAYVNVPWMSADNMNKTIIAGWRLTGTHTNSPSFTYIASYLEIYSDEGDVGTYRYQAWKEDNDPWVGWTSSNIGLTEIKGTGFLVLNDRTYWITNITKDADNNFEITLNSGTQIDGYSIDISPIMIPCNIE